MHVTEAKVVQMLNVQFTKASSGHFIYQLNHLHNYTVVVISLVNQTAFLGHDTYQLEITI